MERRITTPIIIPRLVCETFFKPHMRGFPLRTLRQNDCPNYCPDVLMKNDNNILSIISKIPQTKYDFKAEQYGPLNK